MGVVEVLDPVAPARAGGWKVDVTRGERNGRLSSEWFNGPDGARYLSLDELGASVKRRSEGSLSRVVQTADIRIEAARGPAPGLVHHSDRGSQYCPVDNQALLRKRDLLISLSAIACNRLPAMDERARELLRQPDGLASGKQSTGVFSAPPHLLQGHQVRADLAVQRELDPLDQFRIRLTLAIPPAGRKRRRQNHRQVP